MRRPLLLGVLVSLFTAQTAVASQTTLVLSPANPAVGDTITFTGCGYTPETAIQVQAVHNTKAFTAIFQDSITTDASGCFATDPYVVPDSGKWTANVFKDGRNATATLNFTVTW